ncbi:MAG: hypothetical protein ACNI3A_06355 [Desulfovibrio sp.]|uniref:hypothetical protein n=1 Tax=Desulfovibrio sp. 7SRBS1 TaxID=3378064 RepID=UPI003B427382
MATARWPRTSGAEDGLEAIRTVSLTAFFMQPVRRMGRRRKTKRRKKVRGENLLKEVLPLALPFPELFIHKFSLLPNRIYFPKMKFYLEMARAKECRCTKAHSQNTAFKLPHRLLKEK